MLNYTTINHIAREKLRLSWLEYGLADLIYNLSNNPESEFPGWCYASKDWMGEKLGLTRQHVHKNVNRLIENGLVERHPKTKHLKTTKLWYVTVVVSEKKALGVTKGYTSSNQRLHRDSNQRLHNNNINNKDNNNKDKSSFAVQNKKGVTFSKEDYRVILTRYCTLKGITLSGSEFLPIMKTIKMMFLDNRSKEDILAAMEYVAKQDYIDWTIRTVKMKLPEVLAKTTAKPKVYTDFEKSALREAGVEI